VPAGTGMARLAEQAPMSRARPVTTAVVCAKPKEKSRRKGVIKSLASNKLIITSSNIKAKTIGGNAKIINANGIKVITDSNTAITVIRK